MYYTSVPYTVRPAVYTYAAPPTYVVYETEEPNVMCSLAKVIFGGIGLIVTSIGAVCVASSEMIVSSCESRKHDQEYEQHQKQYRK